MMVRRNLIRLHTRFLQNHHNFTVLRSASSITLLAHHQQQEGQPSFRRRRGHSLLEKPNEGLAEALINSPQLSVKSLPLLSSCLPPAPLRPEDHAWIEENLSSVKEALRYPSAIMENASENKENPLFHLETLLYLAFQHVGTERSKRAKHIRVGHSRLWFLGQYVVELALAEYFLLRYPREVTACIRERIFGLTRRNVLPHWIQVAGLHGIVFPSEDMEDLGTVTRLTIVRAVFWALVGVSYLSMGMREVYRVLFEVFGFDPDAKDCHPSPRLRYEDEDNVYPELEKQMDWRDVATCRTADDALFAKPLLFRACVPPGMQRFRGNLWEVDSLPRVLQVLGYPLHYMDEDPCTALCRNGKLELGLQLCFVDPLAYKCEHPRFCNERLEYLGQKIQDLVMAEKLVLKHLDGPAVWLQEKHRRLLFNRVCGKYLREHKLHNHILYADETQGLIYRSRKSQKIASISVSQALHGLGYAVYGKAEVRRLLCQVFDFERSKTAKMS